MQGLDEPSVTFRGHNEVVALFEPFESDVQVDSNQLRDLDPNNSKPFQFIKFIVTRKRLIKFGVTALAVLTFLWCIVTSFVYLSNQNDTTVFANQVQDMKLLLSEMKTNLKLMREESNLTAEEIWDEIKLMRKESNLTAEEMRDEIKSNEVFRTDIFAKLEAVNHTVAGINADLDKLSSVQQSNQKTIAEHTQFFDNEAPFTDGNIFVFTCVANQLVIDVAQSQINDGAQVLSHGLNNGLNQKWKSIKAGSYWFLSTAMNTNVLKGLDQDTSTGTVQLWSYGHNLNQEWYTRRVLLPFNDVYMIISAANGKAITSNGLGKSPTCEPQNITNALQRWKIQKV